MTPPPLRALTLTQPWATLVAIRAKQIETRSWGTNYRGPLAIHAAAGLGPVGGLSGLTELVESEPFARVLQPHLSGYTPEERAADLPRGGIVAIVHLTDVLRTGHDGDILPGYNLPPDEEAFGDYASGRYAWILDRTDRIHDPIPCRGALGLWNLPPDTRAEIEDLQDPEYLSWRPS